MGSGHRNPLRPRHPVDPVELYERLSKALGRETDASSDPAGIVSRPFPEINSLTKARSFRDEYLPREVLRKYPAFDLGIDTRQRALESFHDDERLNRATNERLSRTDVSPEMANARRVLDLACRKAVSILGRFDVHEFVHRVRFGPGSTTSLPRRDAKVEQKLSSSPHVTSKAEAIAALVLEQYPLEAGARRLWITSCSP